MAYIAKQLPSDFDEKIAMNAGVILSSFDTTTWTVTRDNIIGATTGGVSFSDVPTFVDFGEGIDNAPKNMAELKQIDSREVKLSGTYVAVDADGIAGLTGTGSASTASSMTTITVSDQLSSSDFATIWYVIDYGDGGAIAIKLNNALSTGGFSIQSADKDKASFAFEYTAHYSMDSPSTVPYTIYIKES